MSAGSSIGLKSTLKPRNGPAEVRMAACAHQADVPPEGVLPAWAGYAARRALRCRASAQYKLQARAVQPSTTDDDW